jgi:threonine/homoserine/homoserine lactone efflux protein
MLIFLITFFISFVGSIHPGPLNLSVIQTTLQKGFYPALLLALGGVIPEIIYGYLAVEGVMIFEKYPVIFNVMQWAVVPILLYLGIQQILASRKPKQIINPSKVTQSASKGASTLGASTRGFLLSITNPQLLPYWIVILINYQNYNFLRITELSDKLFFVLGTSTGAFTLNYVYAYIANRQKERIFKYLNESRFEQIIGWTFVLMGLLQTIKLVR